jgi:hypothetical protein
MTRGVDFGCFEKKESGSEGTRYNEMRKTRKEVARNAS